MYHIIKASKLQALL